MIKHLRRAVLVQYILTNRFWIKFFIISLDNLKQICYTNSRDGVLYNGCVAFAYPHGGCRFYFYRAYMIKFFVCIILSGGMTLVNGHFGNIRFVINIDK